MSLNTKCGHIFTTKNNISEQLTNFFEHQQFCDVELIADNDGIQMQLMAHQVILAAASEYFRAMFGGSFKEAETGEVHLDHVNGDTLKSVIRFIYTKSIELQDDTVENILKAADLFQLKDLQVGCCDYLVELINSTNCIGIAMFAERYNYAELHEIAFTYSLEHLMEKGCQLEFLLLNVDQVSAFLSSDRLRVNSEKDVFHTLMSWIEHDRGIREKYLEKLIQHVRLALLQPKFIADNIHPLCACISNEYKDLVLKSFMWHSMPSYQIEILPEEHIRLRSFKDVVIAISGWSRKDNILYIGLYYAEFDKWLYREWPGPPEYVVDFGFTMLGEQLIIGGGKVVTNELSNRVFALDLRTLKWKQLPSMVNQSKECQMTTVNETVYALHKDLNIIEKWNPLGEVWQCLPSPQVQTNNSLLKIGAIDNLLYVVKHSYNQNTSYTFYVYKNRTNVWESIFELPGNVGFEEAVTVNINKKEHVIAIFKNAVKKLSFFPPSTENISLVSNAVVSNIAVWKNRIIICDNNGLFKLFKDYTLQFDNLELMPPFQTNPGRIVVIST